FAPEAPLTGQARAASRGSQRQAERQAEHEAGRDEPLHTLLPNDFYTDLIRRLDKVMPVPNGSLADLPPEEALYDEDAGDESEDDARDDLAQAGLGNEVDLLAVPDADITPGEAVAGIEPIAAGQGRVDAQGNVVTSADADDDLDLLDEELAFAGDQGPLDPSVMDLPLQGHIHPADPQSPPAPPVGKLSRLIEPDAAA
ncbi:MAG: hypothetical protein NTW19_00145, partial [Planctomycetota bacterium]|nr:hypothetical protein [Planctomycetota bacterium]